MRKLKILILSDYAFTKGGAERVAITEAAGLAGRGHKVTFFSAVGPVCEDLKKTPLNKIVCLGQKDILENPNKLGAVFNGVYNRKAVGELKKTILEVMPDIIHAHGVSKALSWAVFNAAYTSGIPVVYTLHDYGMLCPNLGIYNFRKEKSCPYYRPGCSLRCLITDCDKRNYLQKVWRWARFQIVRHLYRINKKVSGYIAVSDFLKQMIKQNLPGVRKIRIIYNPIDTDSCRNIRSINNKSNDFIYVGRLSREKGIDLLLEAARKIGAALTVIGEGELAYMVSDAVRAKGGERINFLGYQERDVIYEKMGESIALILPSRCMEPAPLVIGEAACNYLPSIVAGHGGLTEFVKERVNGMHFKPGDVDSLAGVMNYFTSEPEAARKLGISAHEMIERMRMDTGSHLDKIEKYYYDILLNKESNEISNNT